MSQPNSPFPPLDHPFLAEFARPQPPRRWGLWLAIGAIIVVCGTMLTLLLMWMVPHEARQWRIAEAEEKRLSGKVDEAIQQLDREIAARPRDASLRLKRAEWLVDKQDFAKALKEVDQLLTWRASDVQALYLQTQIYHYLGEHRKAVENCKRLLELDAANTDRGRANLLNELAYARSLADIEIDDGLANIEEAMRLAGEKYAMLDTRGFLYYRKGDLDRALQDLDSAVQFAEADYPGDAPGGIRFPSADPREIEATKKLMAKNLAVIHYHRALLHQKRGDQAKAEADLARVRELGFEPNDKLF